MKSIEIIGGGTVYHVRNHMALTAPAYGKTARILNQLAFQEGSDDYDINLHLTKMASEGKSRIETNDDVSRLLDKLIANPDTKIIFFNPALVDYEAAVVEDNVSDNRWEAPSSELTASGKYEARLKTSEGTQMLHLWPADKLVKKIRQHRKDIFLVAFKTTCGSTEDDQFLTGLHLLKSSSCNLVLANDTKTRVNMIITPEQSRYCVTTERDKVLHELVKMAIARANSNFTRSTVVDGPVVPWDSSYIPESLRIVVDHCVKSGAYKPFNGATVGHFAVKVSETDFITSKRKVNFNNLDTVGMVLCRAEDKNTVTAYGAKPSVGGQSQRIIFKDHPETDCIVHFHIEAKDAEKLSVRLQKWNECGSHECGQNTSDGLREELPGIKCVYLDNHGPNIVFNRNIDPYKVIKFIDEHFDFSKSTDGIKRINLM